MPALDIFCLPSLTEGTPMSLLEAMACGIPVVASAVGGVPDVIQSGKNGILVSPGKPEELKEAIVHLLENKSLQKNLSQEAQITIKMNYNIEHWAKRIEEQYDILLQK
jgi:glycosyltransferase involved in cell wall biosynthesis